MVIESPSLSLAFQRAEEAHVLVVDVDC